MTGEGHRSRRGEVAGHCVFLGTPTCLRRSPVLRSPGRQRGLWEQPGLVWPLLGQESMAVCLGSLP